MIANGHRHGDILEYTLDQATAFIRAMGRLRAEEMSELFHLILIAARGSEQSVKETTRMFTRIGEDQ